MTSALGVKTHTAGVTVTTRLAVWLFFIICCDGHEAQGRWFGRSSGGGCDCSFPPVFSWEISLVDKIIHNVVYVIAFIPQLIYLMMKYDISSHHYITARYCSVRELIDTTGLYKPGNTGSWLGMHELFVKTKYTLDM